MHKIQNILVAVNFSEASRYAAEYAASLARTHNARLYVLHVKEPYPVHGRIVAGSLENVQEHRVQKEKIRLSKVIPMKLKHLINVEEIQVTGIPVHRVIVEKARELGVDVIVMASQNRKGLMRFFKKDMTQQVIQDAPCSVLIVRRSQNNDMLSKESDS
ncbi:MAG: universal stress protein [Desulfobacterales bacterium]|jgi:nucleotide-binding universal stress UspA family protein